MGLWKRILGFTIFLFLLLYVSFSQVAAVDENVVALDLADAEEDLDSAYSAVFEAEAAGANVSSLRGRLSAGGEYLAKAYVWYRLGVFENASSFAGFCQQVVGDVGSEAVGLKEEAERLARENVLTSVFVSAVGVGVVLVSGFLLWSVLKRRYHKGFLRFRPEVVSGES